MRSHENDPVTSADGLLIVLHPILGYEFGNVSIRQFREVAEFHEKATKITKTSTKDIESLIICKVRKRHLEVAETGRTLAASKVKTNPRNPARSVTRRFTGHDAEGCEEHP